MFTITGGERDVVGTTSGGALISEEVPAIDTDDVLVEVTVEKAVDPIMVEALAEPDVPDVEMEQVP